MFSFIICTHKAPASLNDTLASLAVQTREWPFEILLINNGFPACDEERLMQLASRLGLSEYFRIHREPTPGLGFARRSAFQQARGDWLVLLDDDNTIGAEFLSTLERCCVGNPNLGGITACVSPVWEQTPPAWLIEFGASCLSYNQPSAFRIRPFERTFPAAEFREACRPPGGGMIIHRRVADYYLQTAGHPARLALERTGESLVGCQDEDIWRGIKPLKMDVLVTDRLQVEHHIPRTRLRKNYLLRLNFEMAYSYVVLDRLLGNISVQTPAALVRASFWTLVRAARDFLLHREKYPFWHQVLFVARELGRVKGHLKKIAPPAGNARAEKVAASAVS